MDGWGGGYLNSHSGIEHFCVKWPNKENKTMRSPRSKEVNLEEKFIVERQNGGQKGQSHLVPHSEKRNEEEEERDEGRSLSS